MSIKLNLGSGTESEKQIPGYKNIDIKKGQPAYPLEIQPGTIDEIRASHLLEHFSHTQIIDVLKNWIKALKPGGILKIAVPDFDKIIDKYLHGKPQDKIYTMAYIMGGHIDKHDQHGALFNKTTLEQLMRMCGLVDIKRWDSAYKDAASLFISLNLQGTKPVAMANEKTIDSEQTKISAVISMPRLAFTENMFAAMRIVRDLGIEVTRGCGVFWGQVLTRMIEQYLDDGTEYLLTIDYDTWFMPAHVIRLCQLMAENPGVDALVPVQACREKETPLLGLRDDKGQIVTRALIEDFKKPLIKIGTGHFGLTLFRVSSLKKLKRPWFNALPDESGGWGPGRTDEDIYFWNNFATSGLNAFQANEVHIGHLQQVCTFSDTPDNHYRPVHVYLNDLENKKIPEHCIPKIEFMK